MRLVEGLCHPSRRALSACTRPGRAPSSSSRPTATGVVRHAGSRLLADLADATGLTAGLTDALRRLPPRGTGHNPGRIAVDLAVILADGGEAIADLALLRDQAAATYKRGFGYHPLLCFLDNTGEALG